MVKVSHLPQIKYFYNFNSIFHKIFIVFNLIFIGKINTLNINGSSSYVYVFYFTECHWDLFQSTNPSSLTLWFVRYLTRKKEILSKNFITFYYRFLLLKEKVVSSPQALFRNIWLNTFRPLIVFFLD